MLEALTCNNVDIVLTAVRQNNNKEEHHDDNDNNGGKRRGVNEREWVGGWWFD